MAEASIERARQILEQDPEAGNMPPTPPLEAYIEEPEAESTSPEPTERDSMLWLKDAAVDSDEDHIVDELLQQDSLAVVFGASNTGKSTLMIDLELAVAHGLSWRNLETQRGLVIHLAGEGARGVKHRAIAWLRQHEVEPAQFAIWPNAVNFREVSSVMALIGRIRDAEITSGQKCVLLTVDTLMRCLFGSDNDPEHMGLFISACDMIRREIGCAVAVVHHSGKDTNRGGRGHSSLRAAVDTEIEISGTSGLRWATVTKQRDLPTLPAMSFELRAVSIGRSSRRGKEITACVVDHREIPALRPEPRGKNVQQLLAGIREHVRASGHDLVATLELLAIAKAQGLNRNRLSECRGLLERDGWLIPATGGLRLQTSKL